VEPGEGSHLVEVELAHDNVGGEGAARIVVMSATPSGAFEAETLRRPLLESQLNDSRGSDMVLLSGLAGDPQLGGGPTKQATTSWQRFTINIGGVWFHGSKAEYRDRSVCYVRAPEFFVAVLATHVPLPPQLECLSSLGAYD
jgi:hypothetical protein